MSSTGHVGQAVVFNYKERVARNTRDQKRRYDEFNRLLTRPIKIDCSTHEKGCSMRNFVDAMRGLVTKTIGIDISVLTKPYLFAILYAVKEKLGVSNLDVFYTEPDAYVRKEKGEYTFTSGPFLNVEMPGYPGEEVTDNEKLLIILLGFGGDASRFIQSDIEPRVTIPVNGFPSFLLHYKDVSLFQNRRLLGNRSTRTELCFSPASDPFETYNTLDEICRSNKGFAVTAAPLGPKPMALGLAMYALDHPEVRVVEALPQEYSNITSLRHGRTWVYRLSF